MNNYHTLERKKIGYGEYEYFIADENGERVIGIDPKYYNGTPIGARLSSSEEELMLTDNWIVKRDYDTSFRFYEFSYNFRTPRYLDKYYVLDRGSGDISHFIGSELIGDGDTEDDNWGEMEIIDEDIDSYLEVPIYDHYGVPNAYPRIEIHERGNNDIVLKSIIDDNGRVVIDSILDVVECHIDWTIVKLPRYYGSPWKTGSPIRFDTDLWALIDENGKLIIHPVQDSISHGVCDIKGRILKKNGNYDSSILYFMVGSSRYFDILGEEYESLSDLIQKIR